MKKITLLALALGIGLTNNAFAQEDTTGQANKKSSDIKYRSWSVGLNVGANALLGDHFAFETNKAQSLDDFGKLGIDIGLNLNKWINSAYGVSFDFGYGNYSGTKTASHGGVDYNLAFDASSSYRAGVNFMVNLNGFGARNRVKTRRDAWIIYTGIGYNAATASIYRDQANGTLSEVALGVNQFDLFFGNERSSSAHRSLYMPIALEWHYKLNNRFDVKLGMRGTWFLDDNADGSVTMTEGFNSVSSHHLAQIYPNASSDWLFTGYAGVNYYFGLKKPQNTDPIVYIDPISELEKRVAKNESNLDKLMKDGDDDGVSDYFDKDPNTPKGVVVDGSGVGLDTDGDGVPDSLDEDPFSTSGAVVDAKGRELDADGDGIPDALDLEPNTPKGTLVNFKGQTIPTGAFGSDAASIYIPSIFFATDKADITAANQQRILTVARLMMSNENIRLRVVGYCDVRASEKYNEKLADRRAKAAVKELSRNFGISEKRFDIVSKGKLSPISKDHAPNRRVDFEIIAD